MTNHRFSEKEIGVDIGCGQVAIMARDGRKWEGEEARDGCKCMGRR